MATIAQTPVGGITLAHTSDGLVPFKIPSIDEPGSTYYQVFGDLSAGPAVIGLHGGPGAGLNSVRSMGELWPRFGIPVVLYDQLGCGKSTDHSDKKGDRNFWQMPLFVAELENLVSHLALPHGYHVMGASFGGMLAADFATTRPRGLRKLVLCSPNASRELSAKGQALRIKELPPDIQKAIREANESRDFETESYKQALLAFFKHAMCRTKTYPPGLENLLFTFYKNPVFQSISGPAPTLLTEGSMRDWTVIPRLHQITADTLVWNGEFDTSHDISVSPFFELIPRVRWITFPNASHGLMFDSPEMGLRAMKVLGNFLLQPESPTTNGAVE